MRRSMLIPLAIAAIPAITSTHAFTSLHPPSSSRTAIITSRRYNNDNVKPPSSSMTLLATLDPVTYLRTEWVSAALCTNQTPRSADTLLQLGTSDGRIVNFVPRTVRSVITSSAEKEEEGLSVAAKRQLKQMKERRGVGAMEIVCSDQRADDLRETKSGSVDVVVMFQSVGRMVENGVDWKGAVREAGRVLKPGGRFLFVESAEVDGESFLEEILKMSAPANNDGEEGDDNENNESTEESTTIEEDEDGDDSTSTIIFSEVGYDNVDMVLTPHVAGVAIKAFDADLTSEQRAELKTREERDRLADLSLDAFERGNRKNKRRRKKTSSGGAVGEKKEMGMKK